MLKRAGRRRQKNFGDGAYAAKLEEWAEEFGGHPKAKAEEISELEKLRTALQRLAKKAPDTSTR